MTRTIIVNVREITDIMPPKLRLFISLFNEIGNKINNEIGTLIIALTRIVSTFDYFNPAAFRLYYINYCINIW